MGWFVQETVFHHFQTNIPRGGGFLRMIKLDHVEQTFPSYLPDQRMLLFDFIQFFPKDVAEPERIFNQVFIPDHSQCCHSNPCRQWITPVSTTMFSRTDTKHDIIIRSEEHTSELQSRGHLVCRLPLDKK